jgi:hypothetical protein
LKIINWEKLRQQSRKLIAIFLVQIALFGGVFLIQNNAIADDMTVNNSDYSMDRVDNNRETRSVPEQAKNAIDNGLSVFSKATENSFEKLNPEKSTQGDAEKFYDPIEGRKAMDRDNGR